ncbi:uncharacterized protein N7500_000824 [Penicillium coprophilum]|uniref:uncharacterized protein n=1 Tax=Penicillium coprophilum TaxID=36646 RepID=UPI0023A2806F|nr:uncharacterized protein N7500_000824 [Penicillium coprophilum]KAJ5178125.1 hypothetical protein N7500_000824 [Penicillium coprophilum]
MPIRPNLLASRRTRSSIAKHSGLLDRSMSYGSLQRGLFERRRGHNTCIPSVSRFQNVSLPNTNPSYTPLASFQPKRTFSNTTRKEGIWDDDDEEVLEPKPAQRTPGRSGFVRPAHHRDLTSLIRSRAEGKARVSERLRIEKQFNSLPSYQRLVENFIQLKYKHLDDLVVESTKASQDCIEATERHVAEWENRSNFITARSIAIVSDATDSVLQAEKITKEYIAEVRHLSSSILGRIQAAVTKAENTARIIDHEFCCTVFAGTPELARELQLSAQNIGDWRTSLRAIHITLLEPQIKTSEQSIRQLRDLLNNDYLRPRETARSRIDGVIHQSKLIDKNYAELRLKATKARPFAIRDLCLELQGNVNIDPADRRVFGQYKEFIERSHSEIRSFAHYHRSAWLRRQMAFHPLRQSELWNLSDFMAAAASARPSTVTDKSILLAHALSAPEASPASQYLENSRLLLSNKIYLQYKRLWKPKPARSSELHIYWRQLDVIAPLYMIDLSTWSLHNEGWYLHHSLRGDHGALWAWVPDTTLRHTLSNLADWCMRFQEHRGSLRKLVASYKHINWLRLRSETVLHSMGEPAYLAGRFEVLDPISQDNRRFKQWTDRIGQLATEAHTTSIATQMSENEWESIHNQFGRPIVRDASASPQFLELGSSVANPRRRKGLEEFKSPKDKAAFMNFSQSRLSRYINEQVPGHPKSPPTSKDNQGPDQVVKRSSRASGRRIGRLRKRAEQQHSADLAANQGVEHERRLEDKLNGSTTEADDHSTKGKPVSKSPPVDVPSVQTNQEDSRVISKSSPRLWKKQSRSHDVPEFDSSLGNALASHTYQEGNQAPPRPAHMLSKSKDMGPNKEPHLDSLQPPMRQTSNEYPGTRRHNKPRPALMLWRKPFVQPEPNNGRKYSTDAVSYRTKFRQDGDVSDDPLSKRPFETAMTPVPDTMARDGPGSIEENDSAVDLVPSSDIGSSVNNLTTPQFWSHSSQQSPDGRKLIVHYCRTLQSTEEAVQHFLGSKVIGFDMEWKAQASGWDSIQSNVSVIQIANEERIAIFQVALFRPARSLEDLVSPSLKRLIESPDVIKVGVSIKADCTRLRKYLGVDARATFELSHLYKLIKYGKDNPKLVNKRGVNLSEQINEHFGLPLEKSDDVRCSDWTRALNYRQVQYAATDPYACVRLFHTMEAKRQAMNPVPPRPAYAELNQPIVLPLGQAVNSEEDPLI